MIFHIITIFPELISDCIKSGVFFRSIKMGLLSVNIINLRDFAENKYFKIDKPIFGHGRGMLFEPGPLKKAIDFVKNDFPQSLTIYLTPQGEKFDNRMARGFTKEKSLILIAARYEGIDARIVNSAVDREVSVGDYVISGGELPALILMDAAARFIPGSIKTDSADNDSFENGLNGILEYDHYTQPVVFEGIEVPTALRSGDHKIISEFRFYNSLKKTYFNRIDLLRNRRYPVEITGETKNELKILKRENRQLKNYLYALSKISKEWKDGRRNRKK